MHSKTVILIILGFFVLVVSIWLGIGVASDQFQTLLIMCIVIGAVICLALGQRVWLLLLLFNALNLPIIRGFYTQELGQFTLISMSAILIAMRKFNADWKLTEMDLWRLLVGLMILQVYLRAPVGLNIFGASAVGGRPYFITIPAILTGFLLSRFKIRPVEIKWAYWITMIGTILGEPARRLRGFSSFSMGGAAASTEVVGGLQVQGPGRDGGFNAPAEFIAKFVVSRVSPLRSCLNPIWGALILLSLALAALSGYRNVVAIVGIIYVLGVMYRGGKLDFVISIFLGSLALGMLALFNIAFPLPPNMQRALSPLPGSWEQRYVNAGEVSTEWRTIMWTEALFTEKWINNKIIGDGLGMTRDQLERLEYLEAMPQGHAGTSGLTVQQESMMLIGSYHSYPVETVRVIGYIGLLIMTIAFIRLLVLTHRQIMRCKGTEWFTPILFLLIPVMAYPIYYYAIFGTFKDAVAFFFIQSGLVDLIRRNLPLPEYTPIRRTTYTPIAWKNRQQNTTSPELPQ